jgi:hypothetical protein
MLCAPGSNYGLGWLNGLPSPPDWAVSVQHGMPVVVFDPNSMARYGGIALSDSAQLTNKNGTLAWVPTPTQSEFTASYKQVSRTSNGCSRP